VKKKVIEPPNKIIFSIVTKLLSYCKYHATRNRIVTEDDLRDQALHVELSTQKDIDAAVHYLIKTRGLIKGFVQIPQRGIIGSTLTVNPELKNGII
jgi:hypothetical protein